MGWVIPLMRNAVCNPLPWVTKQKHNPKFIPRTGYRVTHTSEMVTHKKKMKQKLSSGVPDHNQTLIAVFSLGCKPLNYFRWVEASNTKAELS